MKPEEQIFISYSRKDKEFVTSLEEDLRAANINTWIDLSGIPAGDHWDRVIQDAIRESRFLVVILSPDSVASDNVLNEVDLALELEIPILPLLYRDCEIPLQLRRKNYIDFSRGHDPAWHDLLLQLEAEPILPKKKISLPTVVLTLCVGIISLILWYALSQEITLQTITNQASPSPLSETLLSGTDQPTTTQEPSATEIPAWAMVTPTPILPDPPIVYTINFGNCNEYIDFENALKKLQDGERSTFEIQSGTEYEAFEPEVDKSNLIAVVQGECITPEKLKVSIIFAAASPHPIALLQEPTSIQVIAEPEKAEIFVQASILYAFGQYEPAHRAIQNIIASILEDQNTPENIGAYWLWGNILLRLDHWEEAYQAYSGALALAGENSPFEASLLANRGLTSLFWKLAEPNNHILCSTQGQEDIRKALKLSNHPDFYALSGTIMLQCPKDDSDIEKRADAQAEEALLLDPNYAPAYALKAQIGMMNQAIPELGDPLLIEEYACRAIELDHKLPDPHRTLGIIYALYGNTVQALDEFVLYGQKSQLNWQRQEAALLWNEAPSWAGEGAPIGLGQCK